MFVVRAGLCPQLKTKIVKFYLCINAHVFFSVNKTKSSLYGPRGGGGGGTPPKLGYNAQHKLKIWTLRDLKTSEKGGLKETKGVFDKF